MIEKKHTNSVSAAPWMKPSLVSRSPASAGKRSTMKENLSPKLMKNSTNRANRVTQTATTRNSKARVAPRGNTGVGATRTPVESSLWAALKVLLGGDGGVEPLLRNGLQRAVVGHRLEDLLDLRLALRIALVARDPDRLAIERLADDLELVRGVVDALLGG